MKPAIPGVKSETVTLGENQYNVRSWTLADRSIFDDCISAGATPRTAYIVASFYSADSGARVYDVSDVLEIEAAPFDFFRDVAAAALRLNPAHTLKEQGGEFEDAKKN